MGSIDLPAGMSQPGHDPSAIVSFGPFFITTTKTTSPPCPHMAASRVTTDSLAETVAWKKKIVTFKLLIGIQTCQKWDVTEFSSDIFATNRGGSLQIYSSRESE